MKSQPHIRIGSFSTEAAGLAQNGGDDAVLSLKDLASETFIVYARQHGPGLYDATTAAGLKAGFSPRLGQEAPRITSALSLVAAALGISVVPASLQRMTGRRGRSAKLE